MHTDSPMLLLLPKNLNFLTPSISQHHNVIKNRTPKTALYKHAIDKGHEINFKSCCIIYSEIIKLKHELLQSIALKKTAESINFRTSYIKIYCNFCILSALLQLLIY